MIRFGVCKTMNDCYPERKIFNIEAKDTWIFGLYNMCTVDSEVGRQVYGVCCTRGFEALNNQGSNSVNGDSDVDADHDALKGVDGKAAKCSPEPTDSRCDYNGRRIVNGAEAARNAYPFMVNMFNYLLIT